MHVWGLCTAHRILPQSLGLHSLLSWEIKIPPTRSLFLGVGKIALSPLYNYWPPLYPCIFFYIYLGTLYTHCRRNWHLSVPILELPQSWIQTYLSNIICEIPEKLQKMFGLLQLPSHRTTCRGGARHRPYISVAVQAAGRDLCEHDCGMNTLQIFQCAEISWQKTQAMSWPSYIYGFVSAHFLCFSSLYQKYVFWSTTYIMHSPVVQRKELWVSFHPAFTGGKRNRGSYFPLTQKKEPQESNTLFSFFPYFPTDLLPRTNYLPLILISHNVSREIAPFTVYWENSQKTLEVNVP